MAATFVRRVRVLVALALLAVTLPVGAHAATLTVSPASVGADYAGQITLNVTGITAGHTVRLESYLDFGGDGTINDGDPMVQSFTVTDGEAAAIGGVRNVNVPGDEDGTPDGKIRTLLRPRAFPEIAKGIASYLYKLSPVTGGFEPVAAMFTITPLNYPQKVTGTVRSGGAPVPFAYAFLITPNSSGPIVGALADDNGTFTLNIETGSYVLGAVKTGFVFDLLSAPQVTLAAGQTVTQDLSLSQATRTISGRLSDMDSGEGIPGAQIIAETGDTELLALAFTDGDGTFTVPISTAPQWAVDASYRSAALLGYLALNESYPVDTGGGNGSGVEIEWPKATALVYGALKDDENKAVTGVVVDADNDEYDGLGLTDGTGNYVTGARAGSWWVGADSDDLLSLGYYAQGEYVTLGDGQALHVDLTAHRFTAHLSGQATDDAGQPIGSICINAFPDQGDGIDATTDGNGNFSVPVYAGRWSLGICSEDAQQRGLVRSIRSFDVVSGADITGIEYKARRATAHISGQLTDAGTNAPLAGVGVDAYTMVDGITYDAWQETNAAGNYLLGVFDATWQVNLDCDALQSRGYLCVTSQFVPIAGGDGVADFYVPQAGAQCLGDCDANHVISPDELVTLVRIALEPGDVTACNGTPGQPITVDRIVRAMNGCAG